ncbi:MAG: tRNA (N(6)-L-threonylcarbamoyladenosine(37)-C(2))-methylthiotransferase MtaB [Chloroflexi bacterium]|nr:tRNA (N(6)-L-threonylcarbamoyladenosine(37)-C(2))-methylthiotransferase MtaB [Chloroflexota bacterium]
MRVYLQTLGCKLNESELESWARDFIARGDELVDDPRRAETIVLNTCTVTSQAARKSRNLARHLARTNADAQIVLTGCYATLSSEQASRLPNVALVVPNADKEELVRLAGERLHAMDFQLVANGCRVPEAVSGELDFPPRTEIRKSGLCTRAFVKIQDGCNMACTYCIIPLARGRARSRPQSEIVDEIRVLVDAGYQEVILTGVQISDYRLGERETERNRLRGLCDLIGDILQNTALPRLRLTSIAPWDLDAELLDLFSDARVCRHLHLSLQSGSSTVLRRMRRPYSAEQFADAVAMARAKIPDVAITTDVIVGFPGEAEVEFRESVEFVERMNFARIHVFSYSPREGTLAAQLPLHVADEIKDARHKIMQRVADASLRRFAETFVGQTLNVLYEEQTPSPDRGGMGWGVWSGYTDNYIRVVTRSRENLGNRIVPTRIVEAVEDGARGELDVSISNF